MREDSGDFFVRVVPFPVAVGGLVMPNDDGTYSIYINANVDYYRQRRAFLHELGHIVRNDFDDKPIESCERL